MKQCQKCNQMIPEESGFCPYCGSKQEKAEKKLFCPICGTELKPDSRFCPVCGTNIMEITSAAIPAPKPQKNSSPAAIPAPKPQKNSSPAAIPAPKPQKSSSSAGQPAPAPKPAHTQEEPFSTHAQETISSQAQEPHPVRTPVPHPAAGGSQTANRSASGNAQTPPPALTPVHQELLNLSSGTLFLVLCILYSLDLFFQVIVRFSVTNLLGAILPVIICIGMWMIYAGSRKNALNTTGFSMINVCITIQAAAWIILSAILAISGSVEAVKADVAWLMFILLPIAILIIGYWYSLRETTHTAACAVKGSGSRLYASLYTMIILGLGIAGNLISCAFSLSLQNFADNIMGSVYSYSDGLSSMMGNLYAEAGLSYGYGYGETASFLEQFTNPLTYVYQVISGLQKTVPEMLLEIAIPICTIILLSKIRNAGKNA